jgi:hypothetical protein
MKSFLRVRYSSGNGEKYFALAYELLGIDFFESNLEIMMREELFLTRGFLDYDKKVFIYSTHKNLGDCNMEEEKIKYLSKGWFELSPGDPEIRGDI